MYFYKDENFLQGQKHKHQDKTEGDTVLCYLYTIVRIRDVDTINRNGTENRKPGNMDIQENSEN